MDKEIKTKVCPRCKREYPTTIQYFYKNKSVKSGLSSICRECKNAENRERYRRNQEAKGKRVTPHRAKEETLQDKKEERAYKRLISEPKDYGIGKEIEKLKFKHGQAYIVKSKTDKGSLWTTFKGKLIYETDDFILLRGKWKECFMKKDFLIGDYQIKEVRN